jgi:hypothetical protein
VYHQRNTLVCLVHKHIHPSEYVVDLKEKIYLHRYTAMVYEEGWKGCRKAISYSVFCNGISVIVLDVYNNVIFVHLYIQTAGLSLAYVTLEAKEGSSATSPISN